MTQKFSEPLNSAFIIARGAADGTEVGPLARGQLPKLRGQEASVYLRDRHGIERAPATLAKLRTVGGGPRFYKLGRVPLYDPSDLDAWAREMLGQPIASTSEARR